MFWRALQWLLPGVYAKRAERWALRYMEQADLLYRQAEYAQAIHLFTKAIELNPQCGQALTNRGIAKAMTGDVNGAITDFEQAISINPRDDHAYCCRGSALGVLDRSGAVADFTMAIAINPSNADAYYGRGVAQYGLGEFDKSIGDCTKVIELQPDRANAYYTRGNCWIEKGEWDLAIEDHSQAIALNPDDLSAYSNRGTARLAKGDVEAALSDLANACERNVVTGFAGKDGSLFSCYLADDPAESTGRMAGLVRWSIGFSDGGWDAEIVGGVHGNDKVFLVVTDRYSEAEAGSQSLEPQRRDVAAEQLLSLLGASPAGDFEGRCPDIRASAGADGRRLRYVFDIGPIIGQCDTAPGAGGTLRIGGEAYDLADGALFLVAHRALEPRVLRLQRRLASIPYAARYFQELVDSDAEIRAFFAEAAQA